MITLDSLDLKNISPEKLGELLMDAKKVYYTTGKPIMDDHTFDTLEEILHQKNPYHRIFTKAGHENFDTGFDKKKHIMPMGSQNKVNRIEDLIHYFELKKINTDTDFVVQPKCDGISLEIEYKNGQLIEAVTRGDGEIGDIITQNVVKMKNFVLSLPKDFSGSIRCEIVILEKDFQKLNQIIKSRPVKGGGEQNETEGLYSNSRNAVSGISQRLDSQFSEYCSLIAVNIFSSIKKFNTELEKINFLKTIGFTPVETFHCQNFDQIEAIYQKFLNQTRLDYPFEIDGLVIKINDQKIQNELGIKNNRPKGQVAYKFPARSSQTRIISIDWQVGPLGMITPVAKVDPIEISGAIITFASLANYDLIKEKNININDIVEVSRRGDVIPHIDHVVNKVAENHILAPTNCPSCGTLLIIESKFLKCPNIQNCPAQILGSLKLFCDALEIKGISDKTIEKLYQVNLIKLPGDFYKLNISDFSNLAGLGEKSGQNIVHQIQAKKTLTLKQILTAASIPNFSGKRIQQLISQGFNTPEKILELTIAKLESLPGIQITLAKKIKEGIDIRKSWIESILSQVSLKSTIQHLNSNISNKSFAITGSLNRPRKEIEDQIISLGGQISSSVSSNTNYLITNEEESNSSKFINARKFGTKIISEIEFESLAVER
ncbi:MAG: NAD-dependent DNA ligase LigA [Candidatus Shapirobacteria bacterium]|nr:NAD-dependent DNA ligase LigA [Candidatus Shapirobacteria bacterium]MDD4410371.1 NAD-dependent DNA ligase LigA [Candidatus Shapirobacteria bacterium]